MDSSGIFRFGNAPVPKQTQSAMDTTTLSTANIHQQQQPFSFFRPSNLSSGYNATPATTPFFQNTTSQCPTVFAPSPQSFNWSSSPALPSFHSPFNFQTSQQNEPVSCFMHNNGHVQNHSLVTLPYLYQQQYGCASSLAMQYLQMAATDQQRSDISKRSNDGCSTCKKLCSDHILQPLRSNSDLLVPTRKWASTCLVGPYNQNNYYSPQPHVPVGSVGVSELKRNSDHLQPHREHHSKYWGEMMTPVNSRLSSVINTSNLTKIYYGSPFNNPLGIQSRIIPNEYKYDSCSLSMDPWWKKLNERVVKEKSSSPINNERQSVGAFYEIPGNGLSNSSAADKCSIAPVFGKKQYHRDPEQVRHWLRYGCSTGPPIKSYLMEDKDKIVMYEHTRGLFRTRKTTSGLTANLPGRFKYEDTLKYKTKKRPFVSSTHRELKEEVQELFKRVRSSETVQEGLKQGANEKTSVLFTTWKASLKNSQKTSVENLSSSGIHPSTQTGTSPVPESNKSTKANLRNGDVNISENLVDPTSTCTKPCEENNVVKTSMRSQRSQSESINNTQTAHSLDQEDIKVQYQNEIDTKDSFFEFASTSECHVSRVKLTGDGYFCVPDVTTLDQMTNRSSGMCLVKDFEVGHKKYGKVMFPGYTNVAGLDLDKIVVFSHRTLNLYPYNEDKPEYGVGLNRPCRITLWKVYPMVKQGQLSGDAPTMVKDPEKIKELGFEATLRKMCDDFQGKHLDYCLASGKWSFMVRNQRIKFAAQIKPGTDSIDKIQ